MQNITRKGCKDNWNAFMVKGASFSGNDIPYCPNTNKSIPTEIITYEEARAAYRKEIKNDKEFYYPAFVCFYMDDYKFDSTTGIWFRPKKAYEILKHFAGIITPDFSVNQDFPMPIKMHNTYRMRAFGYWYGTLCGKEVINNVRWGTPETYSYCFDGIPKNDIVCIGTVASGLRESLNREKFEPGFNEMLKVVSPKIILVVGSANYRCFKDLDKKGITVISFPSKTNRDFARRKRNER